MRNVFLADAGYKAFKKEQVCFHHKRIQFYFGLLSSVVGSHGNVSDLCVHEVEIYEHVILELVSFC